MQYLLLAVAICIASCQYAPVTTTPVKVIPKQTSKMDNAITVGLFIDNRFSFWPRKEQNSPLVTEGTKMIKDFEPIAGMKEVHIPMGDVRSRLAYTLKESGQFKEIINPPTELIGDSLEKMLEKSLETSDYLIVGEVNRFHIRDLGRNTTSALTIPFDMTLLFLPNLVVFPLSQGKSFLLTGNAFRTRTAECVVTMSVTVYEVESGNPITTFRLEEKAMSPVDAPAVYGDFYNDEDDWVDIGRKLGEVALSNACVVAIDKVKEAIAKK
ncbi:hypothetical protein [Candidatus Uabimicrobium sp. HlEnr_7]|uniref:hypothetical protein n=1 Tax=Candidatus Uabimicrobium helgolandensis TaxID=3095367 RepID=UPI0035589B0E